MMNLKTLNYCGLVVPLWMLFGVAIAGSLYPGYSHYNQAMSELHATGSPVAWLSPYLNNYPIGSLFIGFGVFISMKTRVGRLSGWLVVLHGIAHIIAGYYHCDVGCHTENMSLMMKIHGSAGVLMVLTLLLAPAMWGYVSRRELNNRWLSWLAVYFRCIGAISRDGSDG